MELEILGFSKMETKSPYNLVTLCEKGGTRRLHIPIGDVEYAVLKKIYYKEKLVRPFMVNSFIDFASKIGYNLVYILIYKIEHGIFFSKFCYMPKGCKNKDEAVTVECRTTDAICLSLLTGTPINIISFVFDEACVIDVKGTICKVPINSLPNETLQEAMEEAVASENYEYAEVIRRELEIRKKYERG